MGLAADGFLLNYSLLFATRKWLNIRNIYKSNGAFAQT